MFVIICIENFSLSVISPTSSIALNWAMLVSFGAVYNSVAVVIFIYTDIYLGWYGIWLACNFIFDIIFAMDIFVLSRISYTVDGELERDYKKVSKRYFSSNQKYLDILAIMPTDLLLFANSQLSIVRLNRLLKCYRIKDYIERALMLTKWPNTLKISMLITVCLILFHWNGCLYFFISLLTDIHIEDPNRSLWTFTYTKIADPVIPNCDILLNDDANKCWFNESGRDVMNREPYMNELIDYWSTRSHVIKFSNLSKEYSFTFYWSSMTLTTKGQQPWPTENLHYILEIVDTIIGLLIFAVIVESVGGIVLEMNQARTNFQHTLDGVKFYMNYRNVKPDIQHRVILACEYLQHHAEEQRNEKAVFNDLPTRLRGQMAVHLHMDTLKKVDLLEGCDPSLLYELLLRLKFRLFSPGDYLCRRGDIAKEMYIVEKGRLLCLSDNEKEIYKELNAGDVFGQLSILKIPGDKSENRRPVAVCSAAYTNVYLLGIEDFATLLQDYPEDRKKIVEKGLKLLKEENLYDKKLAENKLHEWHLLNRQEQLNKVRNFFRHVNDEINTIYTDFNVSDFKNPFIQG